MRYMLLMHGTPADWRGLALPDDVPAQVAFMREIDQHLLAAGELVSEHRLCGPETAKVVRARSGGAPVVTSAPVHTQPTLAGYWIVDCDSPARAIEVAARVSASPGRGGVPLNLPVEVRAVMRAPGEEM